MYYSDTGVACQELPSSGAYYNEARRLALEHNPMSLFTYSNWFVCILTSVLLLMILWRQRFLLVKPSIIVIIFFHLRIQWAATINSAYIGMYLPDPWVFGLLSQGFPLMGLFGSLWIGRRSAWIVWQRVVFYKGVSFGARRKVILLLGLVIGVFTAYYLRRVPFSVTGIYTILVDPSASAMAREESLKLVGSGFIRYGYSFMASAFAPLLSVLILEQISICWYRRKWVGLLANVVVLCGVLFAVSLTGARGFAASIILVMAFAWLLRSGFPLKPIKLVFMALLILSLPVVLTVLREGKVPDIVTFWSYLAEGVFNRTFYGPMETGLYFTHFAQTSGLIGIAGVPKLATAFGISPLNAPNHIGLLYTFTSLQSIHMNTSFVFAYYCYFGLASLFFCLCGLWLLDLALMVYRKLSSLMLVPCIASASISSISLISTEYSTVLLTHGFVLILIVSLFIDRLGRIKIIHGASNTSGCLPSHVGSPPF